MTVAALVLAAVAVAVATSTTVATTVAAPSAPAQTVDRSAPGPYTVGRRTATIPRAEGEAFEALVLYPAAGGQGGSPESPADDAPVASLGAPFAAIAFGHGFLQAPERYAGLLGHLASWGHVVVAPASQTGLAVDHAAFAADLSAALAWLEAAASEDANSVWLAGRVDATRLGLAGHSMGGGAALLAAAADPRVAAWLVLAPAETSPSAVSAMADVSAPGVVLAGDEDVITPLAEHARPIFEAGAGSRQLVTLRGGSHCGFQDDPFPIGCQEGSLPWARQLALTRGWLTAFFDLHLGVLAEEDEPEEDQDPPARYGRSRVTWRAVWGPEASADRVVDVASAHPLVLDAPPLVARGHGIARAPVTVRRAADAVGRRSVELRIEPGAWPVIDGVVRTPALAAGEAFTGTIEIAVPLHAPGRVDLATDEALVSAWVVDGSNGRARAWAPLRITRATPGGGEGRLWLPWLAREARR